LRFQEVEQLANSNKLVIMSRFVTSGPGAAGPPGPDGQAGSTNISVVALDSFWIDGYFEETKMARIHVGDVAEAKLRGYPAPVQGRVETITRGIATGNSSPSTQGLPNVDPVYTWVRLAQRVPVRIKIEQLPEDIPLVAGMTATVTVRDGKDSRWSDISSGWSALVGGVSDLFRGIQDVRNSLTISIMSHEPLARTLGPRSGQ
jgi:Cation efflux system protein CusB domain 1